MTLFGWVGTAAARTSPAATGDPVATIRYFDRRLRQVLRRHVPSWSPEAEAAEMQIHQLVDDTLCVPELARRSLGSHWLEATDQQRLAFVSLFRELIVKRIVSGQLLAYEPETAPKLIQDADGTAEVGMAVHETATHPDESRRALLDYKLRYLAGRWQLVDLLVDDQSLVGEYRYQFDRIIVRERFEGLLERMRKKVG